MISKVKELIALSVRDSKGKISHIRISSYFILVGIMIFTLLLLAIDLTNAIHCWYWGKIYVLPVEHSLAFGMILTHHLVLLGLKKAADAN